MVLMCKDCGSELVIEKYLNDIKYYECEKCHNCGTNINNVAIVTER